MHRRISLIVATYEWPEALDLVLASVAAQTKPPHEVLVCDDGSGPLTGATVDRWRDRLLCDLRHVWQPHEGARAARVRNLGVAAAAGEYVVVLDGDRMLERHFVADHAAAARLGQWVQGTEASLSREATAALLAGRRAPVAWWRDVTGARWRALHSPYRAARPSASRARLDALDASNHGYWRSDLLRVNGFDERCADAVEAHRELAARLDHIGLERVRLRNGGISYRCWRPRGDAKSPDLASQRVLTQTLSSHAERSATGLDAHVAR